MDQPSMPNDQPMTRRQRRELKRQQQRDGRVASERGKTIKTAFIWIGVVVVVVGGIIALAKFGGSPSGGTSTKTVNAISADDWTKGTADAKVNVIEYSDPQCPACASYEPIVKQVIENYGDKIQFVYRHFPLRSIHKNGQMAAQFAEAAGQQGKFWEYHDKLFDAQSEWSDLGNPQSKFKEYGKTLELDEAKLESYATSQAAKDRVDNDYNSGAIANVNATPTFFLNGKKISNPQTYQDFAKLLDEALKANP